MSRPEREDFELVERELHALEQAHARLRGEHALARVQLRRRVGTGMVAGFTVVGVVLGGALGWQLSRREPARPPAPPAVQRVAPQPRPPRPARLSQPAPVFVQGVDAERYAALEDELQRLREHQAVDQERIRSLTEHLLRREREFLAAQLTPAEILAAVAPVPADAEPAAPEEEPPDPWLPVLNDLLAVDGYHALRFETGTRVAGVPELTGVTVLQWDENGIVDALIKAERARFELHRMTETLVVRFFDGHRTVDGVRLALPPEGARLDFPEVRAAAWLEHFPELEAAAGPEPSAEQRRAAEGVRRALDGLLSHRGVHGYYRLAQLGAVEARRLRFVQLQWFDGGGALLKTFDADALEIHLHDNGTVELVLENGAILEGFLRRPFAGDQFRLYLTQQPLADWRRSGAPCLDAGP